MREIKFRGKEIELIKEIGAWRYGSLVESVGTFGILTDDDKKKNPVVSIVDRKTVGQYAGLKDKDGIEIYEGDIVTVIDDEEWISQFGRYHEMTCDSLETFDDFGTTFIGFQLPYNADSKKLLIAGNIYDNPELLGGEK